ncbi:MBL fold metallo-hydrolase [Paenibacillus methanolicus]|uniref:Ribonuclease BN (tRNA processing enzyme) n=1 Tax=Paenibacillus methanolicus TaxID=582686 RepID=A0A5S5CHT2_9BACL|nr:MBL fold metallo-hydrolase [Paenibacillus methanolicus]TYP77910.1 ribonuclease BN (tRNA processing enzyme) [Paenibacillus methanolicus]
MNIQMLGTGSAFAKRYYNNNALLFSDGQTAMLDCGITAPMALHQLSKTFNDIHALVISHIHADHVGGMEEFAFQMKFVYKRSVPLFVPAPLIEPLWETTLKGGLMQEECQTLDDYFEVRPLLEGQSCEILPGLAIRPIRTKHIAGKPSYSYVVNDTFFYSADMKFDAELLHALVAGGCQVIFHDCQLKPPGAVHTTLEQLLSLPPVLQERIWLMHYDDTMPDYEGKTGAMRFVEQHRVYSF